MYLEGGERDRETKGERVGERGRKKERERERRKRERERERKIEK